MLGYRHSITTGVAPKMSEPPGVLSGEGEQSEDAPPDLCRKGLLTLGRGTYPAHSPSAVPQAPFCLLLRTTMTAGLMRVEGKDRLGGLGCSAGGGRALVGPCGVPLMSHSKTTITFEAALVTGAGQQVKGQSITDLGALQAGLAPGGRSAGGPPIAPASREAPQHVTARTVRSYGMNDGTQHPPGKRQMHKAGAHGDGPTGHGVQEGEDGTPWFPWATTPVPLAHLSCCHKSSGPWDSLTFHGPTLSRFGTAGLLVAG